MTIRIGDTAPDFTANTTRGNISFHDWVGNDWCLFVSHPKDFTPICTTELGLMVRVEKDFSDRGVKLIGHSIDPVEHHFEWMKDIKATQGVEEPTFPIIGDEGLTVAKLYEMLPADEVPGHRTIMQNASVRAVYVIDPNKKIRAMTFYPMSAGRNFTEILRLVDALQLFDKRKVVTPVNWKAGDPVLIPPAITDEEATKIFPQGWSTVKPGGGPVTETRAYLRYVVLGD